LKAAVAHPSAGAELAPRTIRLQFDHDKLLVTLNSHDVLRRVRAAVAARLRRQGLGLRLNALPCALQLIKFKKSGFMARVFTMELPGEAGAPPQRIPVLPKQARSRCAIALRARRG
jgi:hypothetical protein